MLLSRCVLSTVEGPVSRCYGGPAACAGSRSGLATAGDTRQKVAYGGRVHQKMFHLASPCQILSKSFAVLRLLLDGVNSLELQRDVYSDFTLRVQTDDFGGA